MSRQSKTWDLTINNYTDEDIAMLNKWTTDVNRMVISKEVGESKTPHLQGRITFKRAYRLAALKKLHGKAHWEPTKAAQDSLYCMKYEGEVIINVDNRQQGARNDVNEFVDLVKSGATDSEIAEKMPAAFLKFSRLDKLRLALEKPPGWRQVEVFVLYGPPGTGKSRKARERDPDLYCFDAWDKGWWDGYDRQDAILLDDFHGQCRPYVLQRYLDGHDLQVQVRNGTKWARWTKVYITTNHHPDSWYPNIPEDTRVSIIDRISKIVVFTGQSQRKPVVSIDAADF